MILFVSSEHLGLYGAFMAVGSNKDAIEALFECVQDPPGLDA